MKIDISKEECMRLAELEGDSEVGAGLLAHDPAAPMSECPCDRDKIVDPWCCAAGECVRQEEEPEMVERPRNPATPTIAERRKASLMSEKTRKATTTEIIRIGALLAEHGTAAGGFFSYSEGWDDARIAAEVSEELTNLHISRVRREVYGNFPPASNRTVASEEIAALRADLRALTSALQTATRDLAELRSRADAGADLHAKLCESLSINRVISVGHLAGRPPLGIKGIVK